MCEVIVTLVKVNSVKIKNIF